MSATQTSSSTISWLSELIREARSSKLSDQMIAMQFSQRFERELALRITSEADRGGTRNSAAYLRMIRNMLESLDRGVSRNEFLASIFEAIDDGTYTRRVLMILEGYPTKEGRIEALSAPFLVGGNPPRNDAFRSNLKNCAESLFLHRILVGGVRLEFEGSKDLTDFGDAIVQYRQEFRDLISGIHWICASPLQVRGRSDVVRSLVALYPAENSIGDTIIPPGAKQEWETLGLVPALYQVLQDNMDDLLERVESDTRSLLQSVAPSAIRHELGTALGLITLALHSVVPAVKGLADRLGKDDPDLMELLVNLTKIDTQIRSGSRTTEAFTNLERRHSKACIRLGTLIDEIKIVLHQRLSLARVSVREDFPDDLEIETDNLLLSNVLMNVLMNAIEGIEIEAEDGDNRRKDHVIAIEAKLEKDQVRIVIANDGPEIPATIVPHIFDRGVTSKPIGVGHGYGLFLCRQIASYLGGDIGFGSKPAILPEANVSFLLDLPRSTTLDHKSAEYREGLHNVAR